jgi:hypothetical protein
MGTVAAIIISAVMDERENSDKSLKFQSVMKIQSVISLVLSYILLIIPDDTFPRIKSFFSEPTVNVEAVNSLTRRYRSNNVPANLSPVLAHLS